MTDSLYKAIEALIPEDGITNPELGELVLNVFELKATTNPVIRRRLEGESLESIYHGIRSRDIDGTVTEEDIQNAGYLGEAIGPLTLQSPSIVAGAAAFGTFSALLYDGQKQQERLNSIPFSRREFVEAASLVGGLAGLAVFGFAELGELMDVQNDIQRARRLDQIYQQASQYRP